MKKMEKEIETEKISEESYEPPDELSQEDCDDEYFQWYHNHNHAS
jgi:hypothetical protein